MLLTKKINPIKINKITRRNIIRRVLPSDGIVSNYVETFANYICKSDMKSFEDCINYMVVPVPQEQIRILQDMFELKTKVDMIGLEGVFMKLVILNDKETLNILLTSLTLFNQSKDLIDNIISYTNNIPIIAQNIIDL